MTASSLSAMPFRQFQRDVLRVQRTLPQQVLFAVGIDHVDPIDLPTAEEREIARVLFGDLDRIPASAHGTFALLKGARVGGTLGCSEVLLWSALTCDLSGLARGEQAFGIFVAPRLDLARQGLRYVVGAANGVPDIRRSIVSESSDALVLKRRDGSVVSIEPLAASARATATRGRSLCAAVLDEASFFFDVDSGVVNDLELYRAIGPRVLTGGRLMVLSTAWVETGLLMDLVRANHGAPSTCIAAIAPTLTLRPNDAKLAKHVAAERARDAESAATEFDCVPRDSASASAFIDPSAIDAMVDHALPLGAFP
jgi:hypothetical protein